jgi:hypothetical protein
MLEYCLYVFRFYYFFFVWNAHIVLCRIENVLLMFVLKIKCCFTIGDDYSFAVILLLIVIL